MFAFKLAGGWRSVFTVEPILIEVVDVVQEFRPAEVDRYLRSVGRSLGRYFEPFRSKIEQSWSGATSLNNPQIGKIS